MPSLTLIIRTHIWLQQIHVCNGPGNIWRNLGSAVGTGTLLLLEPLPLLPIGCGQILGEGPVLGERPAAGVLDAGPAGAHVGWIAPALLVGVGGRGSTGEGQRLSAAARPGVLLSRQGGRLPYAEPPVRPVRHVHVVRPQRRADGAFRGVTFRGRQGRQDEVTILQCHSRN